MASIKDMRRQKRLYQRDLAAALGVTRATYARMEANPSSITVEQAAIICETIGCGFNDLDFEVSLRR